MTRVALSALSIVVFVLRRSLLPAIMSKMKCLAPSCQWPEASHGAT